MSDNRTPIDDSGFSWRRLRALCLKETRQILRDPSSGLIAFVIPLMLLFIFGYGINLDSSKLHLGILMEQQSEDARDLAQAFAGSPYIEPTISDNRQQLIQQMQAGTIRGLVVIPVNFDQRMARPHDSAPIQVITDGSEPNTANFVQGYAQGVWQVWQQQRAADRGSSDKPLIDVQMRYWFNPAAISRHYIIPGAITIIMTVIGAILTSLVIAREWERGTMEALLSTQVTRSELLLSKLIPYYFLGMIAMALCMAVAVWVLGVPYRGSLLILLLISSLFLASTLGMGLLISTLTRNQFNAAMVALNAAFLPSIMLSGFIFQIDSMPVILQVLLFPFAATLEVTNATIAVYSEDSGQASVELTQRFAKAKAFQHVLLLRSPQEIKTTIDNQRALLLIRFPAQFSRDIAAGNTAPLQLLLDGRNSNSAQIAANYVQQIVQEYQNELLGNRAKPNNSELVVRNWYNPNLDYKWFVVPSLIAMITTIGVLIVTSLSVAREREQGTLEQLLVSPLTTWQIFIGKAVPALVVASFQASIVLLIGIFLYQIPFAGSLLLFYATMLIYGLSLVGFGLLISSLCATQQQAFIGVFVFMMPAILLSGYVSPVENMPVWLQDLTWVNPIRHFTDITKQIYLKDASFSIIWHSLWPLLVITATTGSAAYALFRRKIA
ncbi:hypothetical protein SME36J_06020 [Serratia marcescens]|nr:hypothetical protein SME36J_06020 [Serratia marcescens]